MMYSGHALVFAVCCSENPYISDGNNSVTVLLRDIDTHQISTNA